MRKMLSRYWLFTTIFAAASLLHVAEAKEITGITIDPSTAKITALDGVNVKITIYADADAPPFCGLQIEYGNGVAAQDVKIDSDEGLFPRVVIKKFTAPGTYTIRVKGKKVTTHLPCPGKATAVLVVERTPPLPQPSPVSQEQKFFKSWF